MSKVKTGEEVEEKRKRLGGGSTENSIVRKKSSGKPQNSCSGG